jgi:hypothetical protein
VLQDPQHSAVLGHAGHPPAIPRPRGTQLRAIDTPDSLGAGLPTPSKSPTEGLQRIGRPSVDGVARSGDRPQRASRLPADILLCPLI